MLEIANHDSTGYTDHLLGNHNYSLDRELPVTVVEQVLQTGAQQVNDQDVVQTLLAKIVNIRDPGCEKSVESLSLCVCVYVCACVCG